MAVIRQGPGPENRFSLISHEISRNPEISLRTKGVYIFLRSHTEGWSMSVARIAEALGVSPDTISKAVNELEDHGFLIRNQTVGGDGRFGNSEYVVMSEPLPKKPSTENPDDGKTVDRKIRSHKKTIPKKNNLKEEDPPIVPQGIETDAFFDGWYEHYPKKAGRGQAVKAFKTAIKKTDLETMIAATLVYAKSVEGKEKRFIKNPSTWLNGECWLDDVDVPDSFDDVGGDDELRL